MSQIQIDERIAPQELIVGINNDMCYVTYMEGKKMNSEKSWTSWSSNAKNPLKVQNKFAKGFSLGGVNDADISGYYCNGNGFGSDYSGVSEKNIDNGSSESDTIETDFVKSVWSNGGWSS